MILTDNDAIIVRNVHLPRECIPASLHVHIPLHCCIVIVNTCITCS